MRESLAPGVWGVVATPFQGSTLDVDTDSLAGSWSTTSPSASPA